MACPINHDDLHVRPARQSPGAELGVDEALIKKVVHHFYDQVRADEMLGAIFNHHVDDWSSHLDNLCAFWSSVMLTTGRYKGTPMQVHVALSQDDTYEIGEKQFERWLVLFAKTVEELCNEQVADLFLDRANRIASSLQMSININRGKLLG